MEENQLDSVQEAQMKAQYQQATEIQGHLSRLDLRAFKEIADIFSGELYTDFLNTEPGSQEAEHLHAKLQAISEFVRWVYNRNESTFRFIQDYEHQVMRAPE